MVLSDLRKETGLTQEEVARSLNITLRTYQNYESGQFLPPLKTFKRISLIYNVSLDYLYAILVNND